MMMSRRNVFMVLLLLLSIAAPAHAEELTGEQIARRMLPSGVFEADVAGKTKLRMVLVNKSGKQTERNLELLSRRKDGLVQSVVRFRSPQDVAGTAFLMIDKKGGASEQYIYLPRLRRTRRIVGGEREGSFMGSDFAYSDMRRVKADDASHKRLDDSKIGNDAVYVLESTPKKNAKTVYTKLQTWVRKSDFLPLRTRFYGTGGKLAKTLYVRRVEKVDGKPVVKEARMESHANNHATVMIIDGSERKDDLPDSAFTPTALEHP
ncbi:MAG TPA: outer membrane lipoprotein-sorting protein [Polyangiaceae bacterium]